MEEEGEENVGFYCGFRVTITLEHILSVAIPSQLICKQSLSLSARDNDRGPDDDNGSSTKRGGGSLAAEDNEEQ